MLHPADLPEDRSLERPVQEDKDVFNHAAGYCIVDVATPERSDEIAARWPDAQHWGMEIRPLMRSGGEED